MFNEAGLDAIACPWFHPENVINYSRAAARLHALRPEAKVLPNGKRIGATLGVLDTTWAGWNFDRKAMEENTYQVVAYILAADAAWSGGATAANRMPYEHYAEYARLWNEDFMPWRGADGWTVNLDGAANLPLTKEGKDGAWLGYATGEDLAGFPTGRQRLGRFLFDVPKGADGKARGRFAGRTLQSGGRVPVVGEGACRQVGLHSRIRRGGDVLGSGRSGHRADRGNV